MNKKGQQVNYFIIILFLVGFGFTSIMSLFIYNQFVTVYESTGYLTGDSAQDAINGFRKGLEIYDDIILLVLTAFVNRFRGTSYKLRTHPMFFIVTLIEGAMLGFVSYFFNFIFIQLVSPVVFATTILSFPKTIIICTNLHWIALAGIIVGSVTLYAKKQGGEINYVEK